MGWEDYSGPANWGHMLGGLGQRCASEPLTPQKKAKEGASICLRPQTLHRDHPRGADSVSGLRAYNWNFENCKTAIAFR